MIRQIILLSILMLLSVASVLAQAPAKDQSPAKMETTSSGPVADISKAIIELPAEQSQKLNEALAYKQQLIEQAAKEGDTRVSFTIVQVMSELKQDYRDWKLEPAGEGKWRLVLRAEKKPEKTEAPVPPVSKQSEPPAEKK